MVLTPILMKCFEKLVLRHVKDNISASQPSDCIRKQQIHKGYHLYCPQISWKQQRLLHIIMLVEDFIVQDSIQHSHPDETGRQWVPHIATGYSTSSPPLCTDSALTVQSGGHTTPFYCWKTNTPLAPSWSPWTSTTATSEKGRVLGSWDSAGLRHMDITYLNHGKKKKKAQQQLYFLRGNFLYQVLVQDRRGLLQIIETTHNIIGIHLLSIRNISEMRCLQGAKGY